MLSIITITKNNETELLKTLNSFEEAINSINAVYIVYDGRNPISLLKSGLKKNIYRKLKVFKGKNDGIWGAFNYSLDLVNTDYIFINSGDTLNGNPFSNINLMPPYFISVKGIKSNTYEKNITPNKLIFKFNHESIVFPSKFKDKYNGHHYISADLEIFIRLVKKYGWPKNSFSRGFLEYDLSGQSQRFKSKRDLEYSIIFFKYRMISLSAFYLIKSTLNFILGR